MGLYLNPPIADVTMIPFSFGNIVVSQNDQYFFNNVSSVVSFLAEYINLGLYNGEAIVIKIMSGIYYESIDLSPLAENQISSLTVKGWGTGVVIDAELNGPAILVHGHNIGDIFIENLALTNALCGISVTGDSMYDNSLSVTNCTITNCTVSGAYVGVFGIDSSIPTTISNCTISYNTGIEDGQGEITGSALYLSNYTTSPTIVTDCTISHNNGGTASAIALWGSGHFVIRNNRIKFNDPNEDYQNPDQNKYIITVNNVGSAVFKNNLIIDEYHPNFIKITASGLAPKWITIENNSFGRGGKCVSVYSGSRVKFVNNMIDWSVNGVYCVGQDNVIQVRNSLFSNVDEALDGITYDPLVHTGCIFTDDANLDNNFMPIWNTEVKSLCIDNGDPDLNANEVLWYEDPADQDPDGTRKDIGAYSTPNQHMNGFHRLNNYEVKYISIPGVENHPGNQGRNTLQYVFGEYGGNNLFQTGYDAILESISWIYNSDTGEATPNDVPLHYVHSQNGYKVKLLFGDTLEKDIVYSGFYPGYDLNPGMYHSELGDYSTKHYITAPDQLDSNCEIDPNTGVLFRETYLGYYLTESLKPFDALLPILDDIKAIMAEDWALVRIPIFGYDPQPGDPPSAYYTDLWLGSYLMNNENLAINHGEMVVVHYIGTDDAEFKLGGENQDPPFTDSYSRDMTKHFTYEEQLGYIPVFISMDLNQYENGDKPTEVALFIDEECKGAAVIKEGEIQLNAYITNSDDLSDDLKEVEFRLYFPAKSASSIVTEYAVFNLQTGTYEAKTASVADFKEFLREQLTKTGEIPIPVATHLFQNYPNPFNPVTSIKYDLAEDSPVRMDIYNVKGQLVTTILNQEILAGTHRVIWNGKDDQGRAVSSGVYFYRMIMPNKVLTNKMLLLK